MRILLIALCLAATAAFGASLPEGVSLTVDLVGSSDGHLSITASDTVLVSVRFTNATKRRQKIRVYEYHPFHGKLPVPADCVVRDLSAKPDGPIASDEGWWSQYACWSTTFPDTEKRNGRAIPAGGVLEIEFPLHEVLRVPAGGEPEGWMWRHETGYRIGETRFQIAFGGMISREFVLDVTEGGKEEINPNNSVDPTPGTAPRSSGSHSRD